MGRVYDMYPVPAGMENDTRTVLATLGTDYIWACPQRNLSRYMSQNEQPVYYYRFDHVLPYPIVSGTFLATCPRTNNPCITIALTTYSPTRSSGARITPSALNTAATHQSSRLCSTAPSFCGP